MSQVYYWHPNTLLIPLGGGLFRLFQVWYRRNVLATAPIAKLVDRLVGGVDRETFERCYAEVAAELRVADATEFTPWRCALANSDFYNTDKERGDLQSLSVDSFLELLLQAGMVSTTWPPKFDYAKRSFKDRFRGTFQQQIGTEALYRQVPPAKWWTRQKFTDDLLGIRATPYRFIEECFLDSYFATNLAGLDVLEIGCGTGYFTRKIARVAARAVGMDYEESYVEAARAMWPPDTHPGLEFHVGNILDLSGDANPFRGQRFDRVILIDTFLFLFDPSFQKELYERRDDVVRNIASLMKDGGLLLVMDPHPLWMTPWVGLAEMPFGILTEYRHRHFKVIPTLEEMTAFLFENGFRVRRIIEPDVHEDFKAVDPKAYAFMKQVPQWWFLEIEKAR